MKYNSIGEQLIAKAQELDPNYKPDKFNDMSEAIDVILNNTGGGKSVPPTLNLFDFETGVRTTITEEEYNNLKNGLYNQVIYATEDNVPLAYAPSKLFNIGGMYGFVQFKISMNADESFSYSSMITKSITIGEKNTSNEYPITINEEFPINPPSTGGGSNIDKLDIEFRFNGTTTLTSDQVALIRSYNEKYVYVKFNEGIVTDNDNIYIGYVFSLGGSVSAISIVSQPNISGNIIVQSLIVIQETTAIHRESTIEFSTINSDKFLKTNAEGEPEWASISMPTITTSITMTAEELAQSINSGNVSIAYTGTDKSTISNFIKAQNGIMKLIINTPMGALYMTLRSSLWKDETNHTYNFEGTLYIETDLSTIGGTNFNQIIVRAICWDTNNSVVFRPTIIPIGTN